LGTFAIPRHVVQAHGSQWATAGNIVTNGPFRLETWRPEERIILVRNSDYHGPVTGNVSRVELIQFDTWLPHEWLRSYEADACDICGADEEIIEEVRQRHANEHVTMAVASTSCVLFNTEHPPFNDRRVRQAFVYAVDRATMTKVALRDVDSPATGGFVPPGLPGHSAGIGLPYDPERARQLLREAGYPAGRGFPTIEAHRLAAAFSSPDSQYLQKQWHDVLGINLQWTLVPKGEWFVQRPQSAAHLIVDGWSADYSDPHTFLNVAVHLYVPWWRNADYEQLLDVARHMTDQAERIKVYRSAEQILMREAMIMPLTYGRYQMVVKPWIKRLPISPLGANYWKDVIIEPH
jgi:ABC-type oligopeptide transport system substrate-binding subunit